MKEFFSTTKDSVPSALSPLQVNVESFKDGRKTEVKLNETDLVYAESTSSNSTLLFEFNPQENPKIQIDIISQGGNYSPSVPEWRKSFALWSIYNSFFTTELFKETAHAARTSSQPEFFRSPAIDRYVLNPFKDMSPCKLDYFLAQVDFTTPKETSDPRYRKLIDYIENEEIAKDPKIIKFYELNFLSKKREQFGIESIEKVIFVLLLVNGKFANSRRGFEKNNWTKIIGRKLSYRKQIDESDKFISAVSAYIKAVKDASHPFRG